MGSLSRTKGASGEREFAGHLEKLLSLPHGTLRRRLSQYQSGGYDLETVSISGNEQVTRMIEDLDRFALEIKRPARAKPGDIAQWWRQACQQGLDSARIPILAWRADRENWQCLVPVSKILPMDDVRSCLRMDIVLFAEFLKQNPDDNRWITHPIPEHGHTDDDDRAAHSAVSGVQHSG